MHNELLECDNWDFSATDWGQASFLQGLFYLGESPFSNDGAWVCDGNGVQPNGSLGGPCATSTIRVLPTFKNTAAPGPNGHPMTTDQDWVFSFDFKIEVPPEDTFGNEKLIEINVPAENSVNGSHLLIEIVGAGPANPAGSSRTSSILEDGTPDRYNVVHSLDPQSNTYVKTLLDFALTESRLTLHYKATNERMDLWIDDDMVLADIQSVSGTYDIDWIQIAGGSATFENGLYDNIILGVLGGSGPIPGDANGDGVVDVADLGVLGANFGSTNATLEDGDFNGDGIVDVADLGILGANWTASQTTGSASALVPEPTTLSLLAMSVLMVSRRRRA